MNKMIDIIENYVKKQFKIANVTDTQTQNKILNRIKKQYINKDIDFKSKIKFKRIKYINKQKMVCQYIDKFCLEYYLTAYYNKFLQNHYNKNPLNASKVTEHLCKAIQYLNKKNNFTIVKFDFKNCYNSLSSIYVFEKFINYNNNIDKEHKILLQEYLTSFDYCFAGLSTSNILIEIALSNFEKEIKKYFKNYCNITCSHLGDDFIMVLDKVISKNEIIEGIEFCKNKIFYDNEIYTNCKNKVSIHYDEPKFFYVTNLNLPVSIINHGYQYDIYKQNNEIKYKLGIPDYIIKSYKENLKSLILENRYNIEKLRIIIGAQTKRLVIKQEKLTSCNKNVCTSLIQSHKVLKQHLEIINSNTINFLKYCIFEIFEELNIDLPYFLKDKSINSKYNLYHNLLKNKSITLNEKFGIKKDKLINLLKTLDTKYDVKNKTYKQLSQDFVILTKLM